MKVALLCATSARTGVETHLKMLALGLARHGVTPILVCSVPGPLIDDFARLGFAARVAAPRGRFGGLDLARLNAALADASLVHVHGPRAIYWSAVLRATHPRRPAVATVHQFAMSGLDRSLRRRAFTALEAWSLRRHDRLITVSAGLRERLLAAGVVPPARVTMIPNSVPLLLERPRTPRAHEPPAHAAVVARLDRVKGVDLLLEAWAILEREGGAPPLSVLGDGPERAALEALTLSLGLAGRVHFAGIVDAVPARLDQVSLYVAPSRNEGLPGAVLAAMACAIPVIATRVGGHRDLFAGTVPQWLVPAEDPPALAAAVRRLLALAPAERLALGHRLQAIAYADYAPERIAAATLDVYRQARGGSAGG